MIISLNTLFKLSVHILFWLKIHNYQGANGKCMVEKLASGLYNLLAWVHMSSKDILLEDLFLTISL